MKLTGHIAQAWNKLYNNFQPTVLPYPMYEFLMSHCKKTPGSFIQAQVTIYTSGYTHINIPEFVASFGLPAERIKPASNSLIGKLIQGGLKKYKHLSYRNLHQLEYEQIAYECTQNNYEYLLRDTRTIATQSNTAPGVRETVYDVDVKVSNSKTTGAFHVHSYILAYSGIQVLSKMVQILSEGYPVYCWNVDGVYTDIKYPNPPQDQHVGGFKSCAGPTKYYFNKMKASVVSA
jgi:hypothetical protein